MNLIGYVKKYGQYSFKEKPFNDVDATILTTAVYSNFEVVAPSYFDKTSVETTFSSIKRFDMEIVTAGKILLFQNRSLIPLLKTSKRFGNIGIKYIQKVLDYNVSNQFYACTYIIPDVGTFIAFRGTDSSIAGWEEDLKLGVNKVIFSQLDAMEYLNDISTRVKGAIYVGGHSKGGNLVLYSLLHCKQDVRNRLVKAYSLDGNGLSSDEYLNSKEYKEIEDRIILIRPQNSIVGQIMYNPESNYIVKSNGVGPTQHSTYTWKINKANGEFIRCSKLTKNAIIRHETINLMLKYIPKDEVSLIISFFIKFFGGRDKTIFDFIFSFGKIIRFHRAFHSFKKEERKTLKNSLKVLRRAKKEAHQIIKNRDLH